MLCGIENTIKRTTAAVMIQPRAGLSLRPRHRATNQKTIAISVLLSVKSNPKGKPVQKASNANFCTRGPNIIPPRNNKIYAHIENLYMYFPLASASNPAKVLINMARKIIITCGINIPSGTWPLNLVITT